MRMMKALILAAGYGTRLERDLRNDDSGQYAHFIGVPKPLMPIGNKPLVSHWMEILSNVEQVDETYILTNSRNHKMFVKWSVEWPKVKLVCDGSTSNENRRGAVACMELGAEQFGCADDLIIIAGDTLFHEDFDLKDVLTNFNKVRSKELGASLLVYVTCKDEDVHKYGILETDTENRVVGFLEKPSADETTSRKECPCFYLLSKHALPLLHSFLDTRKDEPLKSRDATGHFISYLYSRMPVYAMEISGRFDVGGLQTYLTCDDYFKKDMDT